MDSPGRKSLKEKWQDHWETRNSMFNASQQTNMFGVTFFWFFTLSLFYTTLWILIPTYPSATLRSVMSSAVWLIFVESLFNWFLAARSNSNHVTSRQLDSTSDLPEGWKTCITCQMVSPPRAHHCKICDKCVLKRDHHCFFTG